MHQKILNEAIRAKEQWSRTGPNVVERQTRDMRHAAGLMIGPTIMRIERQLPSKAKTRTTKQQIALKQRDGKESVVSSPPSFSMPSRVSSEP